MILYDFILVYAFDDMKLFFYFLVKRENEDLCIGKFSNFVE
jgi:hypothetical protein